MTWSNNQYDFQGGCDQIAIDNGNLQVQIRTRPRGHYSTIVEVVALFKLSGETFVYKMNHKSKGGGYTAVNKLTSNSVSSVTPTGGGYMININSKNLIRVSGGGIGITLEVRGGGGYMFDSVGMCGSWNKGYARFKNGKIFNTSGGYSGTRGSSISLAKDWQVPVASSALTNPSDICDASAQCGPGKTFACDDVGGQAAAIVPGCTEVNCNKVTPILFRYACEDDVALTGDTSYACKYLQENPLPIYYPKPGEFGPDTGSPVAHKVYTIGSSGSNPKNVNLGQSGWIVSPVPYNYQHSGWNDRFSTSVSGTVVSVKRLDQNTGWGQQLQLMAIKPIIHVGTLSHDGSKEVELFAKGAIVDPTPIEGAGEAKFKVLVRDTKLLVTRVDEPGMGWELDLKLRARFA